MSLCKVKSLCVLLSRVNQNRRRMPQKIKVYKLNQYICFLFLWILATMIDTKSCQTAEQKEKPRPSVTADSFAELNSLM